MTNDPNDPRDPKDTTNEPEEEGDFEDEGEVEEGDVEAQAGEEASEQGVSPEQGGATVHRHPAAPNIEPNAEEFPALVQRIFAERGTKATGDSYAGHLRRFLTWCATKGIDPKTMPPNTAVQYLEDQYPNAVTRAQANVAMRSALEVGTQYGVAFAPQDIPRMQRPPRPKKEGASNTAEPAKEKPAAPKEHRPGSLFDPPPEGEQPAQAQPSNSTAQPAPTPRVTQQRGTPGIPKGRTGVPPLGGRIRISKRSDGTDGYPPGTPILIGMYDSTMLEGEGSIEEFIANRIRPTYGPAPGQRATSYYVDRLDNLGNPIPNSTLSVPVMPPLTDHGVAPQQQQAFPQPPILNQPPQPQSPAQGASFDNFVQYLIRRQEETEKKYEGLLGTMREQATKGGMDPTMFMLLAERMRPEPIDLQRAAEEWKRANPGAEVKWGRRKADREQSAEEQFGGPQFGGLQGTPLPRGGPQYVPGPAGFGGMDPFEAAHAPSHDSVFAEILKQQGEMLRELVQSRSGAQNQNSLGPRELFEMFTSFSRAMQPPPPPANPLMEQLAQMALSQLGKPPEPARGVRTIIEELRELREAQEILGGVADDKPLSFGEVITAAIEHADQIGAAVGNVLSQMPRAPTLPVPVAVAAPPAVAGVASSGGPAPRNGAGRAQAPSQPPPPVPAQQAFVALQSETNEQAIVQHLFTILTEYHGAPDPWPRATKLITDRFVRATTPAEIRALVTDLYVWSGAKRLMNDAILDRISSTLVRHYTTIYASLTGGGQKGLGAEVTPITPTATTEPAPEAVERGEAAGRAGASALHEDEGQTEGESEEPTITYEEGPSSGSPPIFPQT